jgi:cell fate regulator YaaT (PSP1 superfamily)
MNEKDENKTVAEEAAPQPAYEIVGVRFKTTGKIYYFDPQGLKLEEDRNVIVETARGLEFGKVVIPNRIVSEDKVVLPLRPVIRAATKEDVLIYEENKRKEKDAAKICLEKIAEHKLEMKLVDVEYTFDNNKLLFYFTAEGRVDFRELVKSLASIFRTRIELRQIGIRDETKLIGGLGVCGRPFCCKKFLDDFCQVSIKMAKEQNLSLNSQKISGACGRLMCCLRFEHELYEEELAKLPKLDALVETPDGRGIVCELSPLCGLIKVRFGGEHQTIRTYAKDSVKIIANSKKEQKELRESEGKAQGKKDN